MRIVLLQERRTKNDWILENLGLFLYFFMTLFSDVNCYHVKVLDDRRWKSLIRGVHLIITFHFNNLIFDSPQTFSNTWKTFSILYDLYIHSCFQQVPAIHRWSSFLFLSIMIWKITCLVNLLHWFSWMGVENLVFHHYYIIRDNWNLFMALVDY